MPIDCNTLNRLDAKVYSNLSFTYNPDSNTVQWGDQRRTGLPGSVVITYKENRICGIEGRWWEQDEVESTSGYPGHTFLQKWETPTGKVSRVISLIFVSQKGEDDQSGYEAARALISECFDPETGKPVNFQSCRSTAIPKSIPSSEVDGTRDDQEGK
jgi:hypothetical protein